MARIEPAASEIFSEIARILVVKSMNAEKQDNGDKLQQGPICDCNGQAMKLINTIPRIGSYPELHTFRCRNCGRVESVEGSSDDSR